MTTLVGERRARLVSYGGEASRCGVIAPASADELAAALASATRAGRRVTFRGGGCAFDTQSLNTDLVISLARLGGIAFSPDASRARVGAGVPCGELVRAAHRRGRIPPVIVTTEHASAAGVASASCVSRWSPVHGQAGDHLHEVELITARGARLRLGRADAALAGVTGGLGYLGAIASLEVGLIANPHDEVETRVVAAGAIDDVLRACVPAQLPGDGSTTGFAVLLPRLDRGLAYHSRYVTGQRLRRYLGVHQPRAVFRLLGELALRTHLGARAVWWLGYHTRRARYVDPFLDYTFFMDGNFRARALGRRLGFEMALRQQSFVVPVEAAGELIARARRVFAAGDMVPMMSDVLYCPADRALLSANHALDGFVVSFAFAPRTAGRLARADAAFVRLAKDCRALGGRVHLTKHVRADRDDLEAMYAETLPRFRELKRQLDPDGVIRNAFLERVFPSLT